MLQLIGASPASLLDVGGTVEYWEELGPPPHTVQRIVLLNTFRQQVSPPFESVVGDARDLSRFLDEEFDVVFSNSVIGHVGGYPDQARMAREVRRVGANHFIQTPNHGFPLDWRTRLPLFHFLPAAVQAWCFLRTTVGTYPKAKSAAEAHEWATRIRNLRRGELAQLFPGSSILDERVFGFTKSFMIHNFSDGR